MTAVSAWHYDGETGARHDVQLVLAENGFDIVEAGADPAHCDWHDLVARPSRGGARVFGLADRAGWQVGITGDVPAEIAARMPRPAKYGRWIDRIGLLPATAIALVLSLSTLTGAMRGSDWLAKRIPQGWEQRLGRNMAGEFTANQCRDPEAETMLAALAGRLSPPGVATHIQVIRQPVVNAVAMPGGEIVVFDGLLRQAQSPDELAGVLAHEIGHVVNRDTSQSLVRQIVLKLVLGGMTGDSASGLSTFMAANHSREAEAAADDYAIGALRRARISPADTAAFFARLDRSEQVETGGQQSAMAAFLASHPVSDERRMRFAGSADRRVAYAPALGPDAWNRLADICFNDRRLSADPEAPRD